MIRSTKVLLTRIFSAIAAPIIVVGFLAILLINQTLDRLFQAIVFPLSTFHIGGNGHPAAEYLFYLLLPLGCSVVLAIALKREIIVRRKNIQPFDLHIFLFRTICVLLSLGAFILFFSFPIPEWELYMSLLVMFFWVIYFTMLYYVFYCFLFIVQHAIYSKVSYNQVRLAPFREFLDRNVFTTSFYIWGAVFLVPLMPVIWIIMMMPDASS